MLAGGNVQPGPGILSLKPCLFIAADGFPVTCVFWLTNIPSGCVIRFT